MYTSIKRANTVSGDGNRGDQKSGEETETEIALQTCYGEHHCRLHRYVSIAAMATWSRLLQRYALLTPLRVAAAATSLSLTLLCRSRGRYGCPHHTMSCSPNGAVEVQHHEVLFTQVQQRHRNSEEDLLGKQKQKKRKKSNKNHKEAKHTPNMFKLIFTYTQKRHTKRGRSKCRVTYHETETRYPWQMKPGRRVRC